MGNKKQGLVIADVMGKGISASMLMTNIQATLRTLGPESDNIAQLTTRINELFSYNMKIVRFLSLFLFGLDVEKGIIEYSNAGHNPPIFWNSNNKEIELLKPTGPAIGLIKNSVYQSRQLRINPNDLLLLYTDGLIEARDSSGNEYGEERLIEYVRENSKLSASDLLENIQKDVTSFASSFHDDLTLVALKKK